MFFDVNQPPFLSIKENILAILQGMSFDCIAVVPSDFLGCRNDSPGPIHDSYAYECYKGRIAAFFLLSSLSIKIRGHCVMNNNSGARVQGKKASFSKASVFIQGSRRFAEQLPHSSL